MPPVAFLAIPIVIFVIGSSLLWLRYRFSGPVLRRGDGDLGHVAPVLAQRHEAGWRVDATSRRV